MCVVIDVMFAFVSHIIKLFSYVIMMYLMLKQCDSMCVYMCICEHRSLRFGRVDTLGQFVSEFDPEPDTRKKGIGIHVSIYYF